MHGCDDGTDCRSVIAEIQVLNTQFVSATVPVGATTGPVTVTNAGGKATSTETFAVN